MHHYFSKIVSKTNFNGTRDDKEAEIIQLEVTEKEIFSHSRYTKVVRYLTANQKASFELKAPEGHEIISGGFHVIEFYDVYTIDSFPLSSIKWKISMINNSNETRKVELYAIGVRVQLQ